MAGPRRQVQAHNLSLEQRLGQCQEDLVLVCRLLALQCLEAPLHQGLKLKREEAGQLPQERAERVPGNARVEDSASEGGDKHPRLGEREVQDGSATSCEPVALVPDEREGQILADDPQVVLHLPLAEGVPLGDLPAGRAGVVGDVLDDGPDATEPIDSQLVPFHGVEVPFKEDSDGTRFQGLKRIIPRLQPSTVVQARDFAQVGTSGQVGRMAVAYDRVSSNSESARVVCREVHGFLSVILPRDLWRCDLSALLPFSWVEVGKMGMLLGSWVVFALAVLLAGCSPALLARENPEAVGGAPVPLTTAGVDAAAPSTEGSTRATARIIDPAFAPLEVAEWLRRSALPARYFDQEVPTGYQVGPVANW